MARRSLELCCRALIAAAVAYGCSEYGARIYSAHPYRPGRGCLESSVAIGVVQAGELAATCAGQCLLLDETLYVSSVCPPAPVRADSIDPAKSPACAEALGLLEAQTWCERPDAAGEDAASMDEASGSESGAAFR